MTCDCRKHDPFASLSAWSGIIFVVAGQLRTKTTSAVLRVWHDAPVQAHGKIKYRLSPNTLTLYHCLNLTERLFQDYMYQICHKEHVIQLCCWLLPWVLTTQYCLSSLSANSGRTPSTQRLILPAPAISAAPAT